MKKHPPPPHRRIWRIAIAAVLMYGGSAAAAELSVCIDSSSPTASMDANLARAVAAQQGSTLRVHAFNGSGGDEGFALSKFNQLAKDRCALVLGFPIDADAHAVPPGLLASTPYGHTGFVLVTPRGSRAETLAELPLHSDVAVTYQTTPNLYFASHPNVEADVHRSDEGSLQALEKHAVSAAMLWQPTIVRYLASRHEANRFSYHELREPHAQFNLVALYDSAHAPAARAFEQAIDALARAGQLARLLAPYAQAGAALPVLRGTAMLRHARRGAASGGHCGGSAGKPRKPAAVPALYTVAQADSGKVKFLANCAQCHGPTLEGRAGPALKGPNFASAQSKFHVSDIFAIVSKNMPATDPGSLAHDDYVEIMAFLLQQNGYPDGSKTLTFDEAKRSNVKLVYRGD